MDYKEKYNKLVNAIKVLQETNPSDEGIQNWVNDNVPELRESEEEKIRKDIIVLVKDWWDRVNKDNISTKEQMLFWLEKQGDKQQKTSMWKHWENGIAGNGEGEPIYLTKVGNTYSLTSCLGFECDYIELSELDKLSSQEKQGQKPAWSKRDEETVTGIINDIQERLEDYPTEQLADIYFKEIKWLKSIKQRIGG